MIEHFNRMMDLFCFLHIKIKLPYVRVQKIWFSISKHRNTAYPAISGAEWEISVFISRRREIREEHIFRKYSFTIPVVIPRSRTATAFNSWFFGLVNNEFGPLWLLTQGFFVQDGSAQGTPSSWQSLGKSFSLLDNSSSCGTLRGCVPTAFRISHTLRVRTSTPRVLVVFITTLRIVRLEQFHVPRDGTLRIPFCCTISDFSLCSLNVRIIADINQPSQKGR